MLEIRILTDILLAKIYFYQYFSTLLRIFFYFEGHQSFLWGHWYPCFGLLVYPGFQSQGGSQLEYFITCMQWIPQIHLWCDTCWPLGDQRGGRAVFDPHICPHTIFTYVLLSLNIPCRCTYPWCTVSAYWCLPSQPSPSPPPSYKRDLKSDKINYGMKDGNTLLAFVGGYAYWREAS